MTGSHVAPRVIPHAEWMAEGVRLFGEKGRDWPFRCVSCGGVQTGMDFVALGMTPDQAAARVAMSCIGRWATDRGCDWTLGGLIGLHRVVVVFEDGRRQPVFEFATPENAPAANHQVIGKRRVAP